MFGTGISKVGDMIDLAVAKNIIAKTGAWFAYKEERLGQGRENAKEFLEKNAPLCQQIEREVLDSYGVTRLEGAAAAVATKEAPAAKDDKEDKDAKGGDSVKPLGARAGAISAQPAHGKGRDEASVSSMPAQPAHAKAAVAMAATKVKEPAVPAKK
jgi:recombination protein RecA